MTKVFLGKQGISACVIKDSINCSGKRITTMEIEYPRFILSELNTHRMLSKNSQSSRAVPAMRTLELLETYSAEPVWWGRNQPGMQARQELDPVQQTDASLIWHQARQDAVYNAEQLIELEVHKQIVNRITEPFHMMKTVVSATEWENFWWLRLHRDAQPEFQELAQTMMRAYQASQPQKLLVGEWHVPYVETTRTRQGLEYKIGDDVVDDLTAITISASSCAQVSYRRLNTTKEKAREIFERLIESDPPHMSPCEHQATPMPAASSNRHLEWPQGITHRDRQGRWWSANFCGWIQYRKTLPGEAKW